MGDRRRLGRSSRLTILSLALIAGLLPPAALASPLDPFPAHTQDEVAIEAIARRQLEELDIPERFMPFLNSDAQVETGRSVMGVPAPDLTGGRGPEVLEVDLRYSYNLDEGNQTLPSFDSQIDTRITIRDGATGNKYWSKHYDRDAWPISMRVGKDGREGIVVISGLWNFYGTTEERTITFDALDGKTGKRLWTREYSSLSYYDLLTYVTQDAPVMISSFDGLPGKAEDLLIGLATMLSTPVSETMATRTLVVDGGTGAESTHPLVDVGVNWWPVPLPTKDLDGDGLHDYATTNNVGVDPGGGQEPPSFGGTVYTRKGTDGSSIWTTSGIEMAIYAFASGLPDVVAARTPDVSLTTYVKRQAPLPVPLPVHDPIGLLGFRYEPRVYLFDGRHGAEAWHKRWEWIYSPGDIDSNGKDDVLMGRFRMLFRRNRTILTQHAADGDGDRLWQKRSVWQFDTPPCPEGLCFGGYGFWFDGSPDVQPDAIKDVLFAQTVQQNAAFEDSITRVINGHDGNLRFEDDDPMQSARVAVDGRGTDFLAFRYANDQVRMWARDGSNKTLWSGVIGGPPKILPRNSAFFGDGFRLLGDRCGDIVLTGWERDDSFYAVMDGSDGHLIWWRWTGPKEDRPTFTDRTDKNRAC